MHRTVGPEMMLFLDNAGRVHLECSECGKQPALYRLDTMEMSMDNRIISSYPVLTDCDSSDPMNPQNGLRVLDPETQSKKGTKKGKSYCVS